MQAKPRTQAVLPPENVLGAVHALSNRIGRAFHGDVEALHGIGLPEWRVLLTVRRHPGIAAMDVAAMWGMDKMTISRAVRRLERAGRVARAAGSPDRRRRGLTLTRAGLALYARIEPAATRRYRAIVRALTRRELRELNRLLARVLARLPA
jgi:DNA-binding MarR family transcriptional regulator